MEQQQQHAESLQQALAAAHSAHAAEEASIRDYYEVIGKQQQLPVHVHPVKPSSGFAGASEGRRQPSLSTTCKNG